MLCAFERDIGISFHRAKTRSTQRIAQAELCLAKSSKAVYWTLVQYGKGYRSLREIEIRSTKSDSATRLRTDPPQPEADRPFEFGGTKTRRDYNFFSSFLTSAFTFSQKDSFGAFLQLSMRTGIIFSIPAT